MKQVVFGALLAVASAGLLASADEAATKKVVDGLSGFNSAFASEGQFGIYMQGKRLGGMKIKNAKAPEGKGTYRQTASLDIKLGPNGSSNKIDALFDEKLGLISITETETETNAEGKTKKVTKTRKEGDKYVREVTVGEETQRFEIAATHADYGDSFIFALTVFGNKPGVYTFNGIEWPEAGETEAGETEGEGGDTEAEGVAEAKWQKLSLTVAEAAEVTHRGKKVMAHKITSKKGEKAHFDALVSKAGVLLELSGGGTPLRIVAGTAEEVAKDLPAAKPAGGGKGPATTPLEAATIYLKVLSQQLSVDDLDRVMDWRYLYDEAAKTSPEVSGVSVEDFTALLKAEFKKEAQVPAATVNGLLPLLKVSESGATGTVTLPNGKAFTLIKRGKGWWIQTFPKG